MRSECPLNKEGKKDKDKKKKKAMVTTWSDSDPSSFKSKPKMDIKANLCLMAIGDDEVCTNDFDDFDRLQNEYAKHDYDVVVDSKNEVEKCFANLKSKNEVLRLELEEKHKALEKNLN